MVSCIFLLFLVPGLACGSIVRESSGLGRNGSLGLEPSRLKRGAIGTTSCGSGQWECRSGFCISFDGKCDGVVDCPDHSDETFALCGNNTQIQVSKCILPPYPLHGTYTVGGEGGRRAAPGDAYPSVVLNFTCHRGYNLDSNSSTSYCQDGTWYGEFPKCVRACRLNRHESVEHRCLISGSRGEEGTRNCNPYEPDRTIVSVECKKPNYYSPRPLPLMRCLEGSWDTYPTCAPECGRITPKELTVDGISDKESEIPWHVAIYQRGKTQDLYWQLCGGSLVSTTHVISAAHCFWSDIEKILPASNFAVAVGKLYSPWNHPEDFHAQKSEVSDIRIPPKFLGTQTNFQDDIAVLTLKTSILYRPNVGPVCLNFDNQFDNRQLQAGKFGRIAGWRLSGTNGTRGEVNGVLIQFMSIEDCLKNSPSGFREYITSDKFCTGNAYGTTLCKGDSGAGLAFPEVERGVERHYLRGVLSVTPRTDDQCSAFIIAGFTQLLKHEDFVKDAISTQIGLAESSTCREDEWRCNDGSSCILSEEKCDNVQNCEDGSDESSAVCDEVILRFGKCVLPPYPEHGTYTMEGKTDGRPGRRYFTALLSYTCDDGYGLPKYERNQIFCYEGTWSGSFPTCVRMCRLVQHPSVEYRCRVPELDGYRPCNDQEPLGTVVHTNCRTPLYYYVGVLATMRCQENGWDNNPVCSPECGRLTPGGMQLVLGGQGAKRGEVPWHAGIYRSIDNSYSQVCGGSIVKTTLVISAAHCFWNDVQKRLPASLFAVAVGKLYRDWDHPNDTDAQKLEIRNIVIPSRFRGSATNFQDDIALVILATAIRYEVFVRPVCLDFDNNLERQQLIVGKIGKVAGWGLTAVNGDFAPHLQVTNLPYVDIDQCLDQVPLAFRELVTSDKFCAGYTNGTAMCQGDSGGGLAFPTETDEGGKRYFLRGIVSTAPRNNDKCTQFTITTFTQVTRHVYFIKDYL